jgi:TldD protein
MTTSPLPTAAARDGEARRALLRDALHRAGADANELVELRYHKKSFHTAIVQRGRLERSASQSREGVAVRVLVDGSWGFATTSSADPASLAAAIDLARRSARASAPHRKSRVPHLAAGSLAVGDFSQAGVDELRSRSLDARVALVMELEAQARGASSRIRTASSVYDEIIEEKAIVTSDGADVSWVLGRPGLRVKAVAERDGDLSDVTESIGVTGGWDCLFRTAPGEMAESAARRAVELLDAKAAPGGRQTVILSPSIVGLLVHEAIGHTVEADFVLSGSVAQGKIGHKVASELVTLCDSGRSEYFGGAGGTLPVDDEGVVADRTVVIERGILKGYLHNRETAARFGVAPTGNARAWEYADTPLVRMRNTYIEPGQTSLEALIESTEEGLFLDGARNGQADATGEFTFGSRFARRIHKGKLGELLRGVTVTGNAFEVLSSVDGVSDTLRWDLGSGHCGKGQPAKVDAGGPHLRCKALLSGKTEDGGVA